MMLLRPYMLLIILFFALAPAPHAVAAGQVRGAVLYGAGQYRAELDGDEVQKVTTQYGQVSLDYQVKNGIARLGKYSLLLGYEFNILDPTFVENGIQDPAVGRIETGKILYQGDILLAPGGLPFRFNAYARDIQRTSFLSAMGRLPALSVGLQGGQQSQSQTTLILPNILTDIKDGTHHEVGATLLVGIRNGSYLGNYRDVLSQLPRLMIDYRQIEVRDLSLDSSMEHFRERDLAFISLNKKNNWVHFRTHDYKDFLDETQDFVTRQVMIGTVDQSLSRQWINLTNWIKISGDLSFTVEKRRNDALAEHTYRVNLLTVAQRQEFKASVLSAFERSTREESMRQELDLPVYFNYEPNRETYYRGSLRTSLYRQSLLAGYSSESNTWQSNSRDVFFDLGSELFRTRAISFKPHITLGVRESDDSQGFSEKLVLEWVNKRGKSSLPWAVGYYIASTQTSSDTSSSVYLEQSLYGNVEKNLSRAMRVGLSTSVRKGGGHSENDLTEDVTDDLEIGAAGRGLNKTEANRFFFYYGAAFGEYVGERFSNRLECILEGIKNDVSNLTSTEVRHILRTARRVSTFSLTSSFLRGNSAAGQSINTEYVMEPTPTTANGGKRIWSSKAEYLFTPDRRMSLTLTGSFKNLSEDEGSNNVWLGSERLEYRFYKSNGLVRKIAEISEEFGAEGVSKNLSGRNRTIFLRVVAAVYPTKYLYAKVASDLVVFSPSNSEQMMLNAETGADFNKLQVSLSYGRGYKAAEGLYAEVKEERWDMKVKKTF